MARRRNPPESVRAKWQLADRLRTIRTELFGERGLAELARQIGVPIRTWYSYETGVTVPAEVLLRFVELTLVEPNWLLHGQGSKYQTPFPSRWQEEAFATRTGAQEEANRSDPHRTLPLIIRHGSETEAMPEESDAEGQRGAGVGRDVSATIGPRPVAASVHADPSQRSCRCVRIEGDAMEPILADGAFVAFADDPEEPGDLEGKLVVARLEARPIVRWFHHSGHFAVLRAENPAYEPGTELIDLNDVPGAGQIRRVLWIGTPH